MVLSYWAAGSMLKLLYGVQLLFIFYVGRNTFKDTPPQLPFIFLSRSGVMWNKNILWSSIDVSFFFSAETFWEVQIFFLSLKVLKHDWSWIKLGTGRRSFFSCSVLFIFCDPHTICFFTFLPPHIVLGLPCQHFYKDLLF